MNTVPKLFLVALFSGCLSRELWGSFWDISSVTAVLDRMMLALSSSDL